MKKILLSLIAILTTIIGLHAQNALAKDSTEKKNVQIKYTCSMHPEIISDKPGKCPKCGMDLIPVSASSQNTVSNDNSMSMMPMMMMGMNHSGNKKNRMLIILGGAVMVAIMFFMIGVRNR